MHFNAHSELLGKHAFLAPSNYHWINYTEDKVVSRYFTQREAVRGTEMHELARNLIRLQVKLAGRSTIALYVNDAIGYRMQPEQPLFYSFNCFGTADTISFKRNLLRIHDLKNGVSRTSMKQLICYAALFCLEYGIRPGDIRIELRIYQNDDIEILNPEVDEVAHVMDRIITFDKRIQLLRMEEDLD